MALPLIRPARTRPRVVWLCAGFAFVTSVVPGTIAESARVFSTADGTLAITRDVVSASATCTGGLPCPPSLECPAVVWPECTTPERCWAAWSALDGVRTTAVDCTAQLSIRLSVEAYVDPTSGDPSPPEDGGVALAALPEGSALEFPDALAAARASSPCEGAAFGDVHVNGDLMARVVSASDSCEVMQTLPAYVLVNATQVFDITVRAAHSGGLSKNGRVSLGEAVVITIPDDAPVLPRSWTRVKALFHD